jgi:drug/metabolite transporter (DMT)-like permease
MDKTSLTLLVTVILIWGLNWSAMKIGLMFVDPLSFVMQRFILASIVLLAIMPLKVKGFPRDRKTWLRLLILSLINTTQITLIHVGLMYENSGLSSLVTYTQPLFVFCLAVPFLGEKASVIRVLGALTGFLGVVILYAEKISLTMNLLNPILFLIFGAFLWAVTIVYYKKFVSHVNPLLVNAVQLSMGFAFISAVTLALRGNALEFNFSTQYVSALLYSSIIGLAMGSTIWLILIRKEETISVTTSSLIVPVVAAMFGWILLGENISILSFLSFVLVLMGIYLVNRKT